MDGSARGVIVDSHLWIEFFSREKSKDTAEVARLIRTSAILMVGPVLYEVLVGPRREAQRQYLEGCLRAFPVLETTREVWLHMVDLGRLPAVASREIPFSDVLIAAHAESHGSSLFTRDPHFDVFPRLKRHRG